MKICVISYHSSPLAAPGAGTSGGMSIVLANVYKRLAPWCDIDIFVYGKQRHDTLAQNVHVHYLACPQLDTFAERIISIHQQRHYDLFHTHYWLSGLVGLRMKKIVKIPWLHSFHTVEIFKGIIRDTQRIEVEEEIIRSCDFIISPTHREASAIKRLYPASRVITIPHGVDTQQFTQSPNGHRTMLFVGRIEPIKGLDILVRAMRRMDRDVQLTIIGGPSKGEINYDNITSYADGLHINFLGRVGHEQLSEYYKNAGMIIVPSYYESFGLVGLEAMASARPVIGFEDTGLSETVGRDAGILVKRNEHNLAQAMNQLLDDHNLRHDLASRGWKKAQKFDWHTIAVRYYTTYEKIIKK
jgi:D-inositol-3-phosphate glycosyltransferase